MADEYHVYVGFASANPGRCGCAVVVTRGDRRAERTTTIAEGTASDAAYGAFLMALALIADRTDAPVVIVVPSLTLRWLDQPPFPGDGHSCAACKRAFATAVSSRDAGHQISIHLDDVVLRAETSRAMDLAYEAAFGKTRPVVPPRPR